MKRVIFRSISPLIAVTFSLVAAHAAPQADQLKPVLQAIDPSQARIAPVDEAPPSLPSVPPQMQRQPQQLGWGAGWAPAVVQTPNAPDDPRVARLEQIAFGANYPEHDTDDRIEHLEREVFGQPGSGTMESRIQKLQAKLGVQGAFGAGQQAQMPQQMSQVPQQMSQMPQQIPQMLQQMSPQMQPMQQQPYAANPPASVPQQPYTPPQRRYYPPDNAYQAQPPSWNQAQAQAPAQTGYAMPQQGYAPAANPYAQPQQVYAPIQQAAPPASIPQGPVTMQSFNRYQAPAQQTPPAEQPMQAWSRPPEPPPTDMPPQQLQQQPATKALNIPFNPKAGDYCATINKFEGRFARWTDLPVRAHIPMNTQENWKLALQVAINKWRQHFPLEIAPASEPAHIEIAWINHLPPGQLGITNLEIFNGKPRVTIYLLRPSNYPANVSDRILPAVAIHHLGHGLGLFGHSPTAGDVMHAPANPTAHGATISPRDLNTLRKVYSSPPLPDGFQSPQPISWQ